MRIPKTINLCGKPCKVLVDASHDGGTFCINKREIVIGIANPEVIEENFIHEVSEAILAVRDYRYALEREELDNGDYRFFMNHQEFQLFARDLSIALRGVDFTPIKKNENNGSKSRISKKTGSR